MTEKKDSKEEKIHPAQQSGPIEIAETEKSKVTENKRRPIRLATIIVLIISVSFLAIYILSDRHVPYCDQAKINGLMLPVVPRVSGNITKIRVHLHSRVKTGDTLFQIDQRPYLLAIEKAEANLDNTAQNVAARTATVKSSAGRLGVARAQLDRAERNWARVQKVLQENPGALSQSDKDQAETSLSQATEQVASAEADLERSQQMLGFSGEENPQFRAAVKELEQAQLDLAYTSIISASDGYIESFSIDLGFYASAGQPLTTLISESDVWIQADMKENNLSNIRPGDKVEFSLDVAPGKVFEGKVRSIGHGVATGNSTRGDLPTVSGSQGWLRDPQRFPVIISFDKSSIGADIRLGGQAEVVVYTREQGFLKTIGKWRIRVLSWVSYAR